MASSNSDLPAMPEVLQQLLHDFKTKFAGNSEHDSALLLAPGPVSAQLSACKIVLVEGLSFQTAMQEHEARRAVLLQRMIGNIQVMANREVTRIALHYARMLKDNEYVRCYTCAREDRERLPCGCKCSDPVKDPLCAAGCTMLFVMAVYYFAFPRNNHWLLESDDREPGKLTDMGKMVEEFCAMIHTDERSDYRCLRQFTKDYWAGLLEEQKFVDERCCIRFEAVAEFYRVYERPGFGFSESNIYEIEKKVLGTRLKASEEYTSNHPRGGPVWEHEYERRRESLEARSKAEGKAVYPQVPT